MVGSKQITVICTIRPCSLTDGRFLYAKDGGSLQIRGSTHHNTQYISQLRRSHNMDFHSHLKFNTKSFIYFVGLT